MKNGFANLLILSLLASLLILGVAFYFTQKTKTTFPSVTPSSRPTSSLITNWKTYTDSQDHYSLSYPSRFLFAKSAPSKVYLYNNTPDEGNESYTYVELCEPKNCVLGEPLIDVTVFENFQKWNLSKWVISSNRRPPLNSGNPLYECLRKDPRTKTYQGIIQNMPSYFYEYVIDEKTSEMKNDGTCTGDFFLEGGGNIKDIAIENNGKIYLITMHYRNADDFASLNKILSTFKFTN